MVLRSMHRPNRRSLVALQWPYSSRQLCGTPKAQMAKKSNRAVWNGQAPTRSRGQKSRPIIDFREDCIAVRAIGLREIVIVAADFSPSHFEAVRVIDVSRSNDVTVFGS